MSAVFVWVFSSFFLFFLLTNNRRLGRWIDMLNIVIFSVAKWTYLWSFVKYNMQFKRKAKMGRLPIPVFIFLPELSLTFF